MKTVDWLYIIVGGGSLVNFLLKSKLNQKSKCSCCTFM